MTLNIFYSDEGTNFASVVTCGHMNLLYDMNTSIKEILSKSTKKIKKSILEDIEYVLNNTDDEDEKKLLMNKLNMFKDKLDSNVLEILSCYDKIEIIFESLEMLDKIDYLVDGINVPVILNIREFDNETVLKNLPRIDNYLKNVKKLEVKYLINQCLYDADAHFEDNSYSLDDVLMVINYINEVTDVIKNNNLSPFEQVMYVYDLVKDHNYVDSTDSYLESRDLAKILKNDKRVCVGFATLFKSLLDNLNISNNIVFLDGVDNPMRGHVRNMVVVNDSKYDLNHILYFDATWDCKKEKEDVIDIDRYIFFARERLFFLKKDYGKLKDNKKYDYFLRKDNDYSFLYKEVIGVLYESKKFFKLIDWKQYFSSLNISNEYLEKINFLMNNNQGSILLRDDIEFCEFFYKECCKMLNRMIPDETFLRCLYTVRRIENKLNPNKYSLNKQNILDIYYDYCMCDSPVNHRNFMKFICGDSIIKKMNNYEKEDKNINRLEVLNRLRNLCNSINENEFDMNTSVKEAVKIMKK